MKESTLFGQNVARLLAAHGKKAADLATYCGATPTSVSLWISGGTKNIEGRFLVKVADFFDVHPKALLNELVDPTPTARENTPYLNPSVKIRAIPVVALLQAGQDARLTIKRTTDERSGGTALFPTNSESAYAVGIACDQLRPRFKPGESLIVDPSKAVEPGHEVYVKTSDEHSFVVVLDWIRNGMAQFSSVNENQRPFTIDQDSISQMHRIVGSAHPDMHIY